MTVEEYSLDTNRSIEEILKKIYDTDIKFGLWAYEHEMKKMKYLA